MGAIKKTGTDSLGNDIYRVRISVTGTDGSRRWRTATVHGTYTDAKSLETRLLVQAESDLSGLAEIALEDYFDEVFLPNLVKKGRTEATLRGYRNAFDRWIRPGYGKTTISTFTTKMARDCIQASTSQRNVLVTLRAIMNTAFDDELIPAPISFKRIETVSSRPPSKTASWTAAETLEAAERLRGTGLPELIFLLGICGLRKEEVLAVTPADLKFTDTPNGVVIMIEVNRAYTDEDGLKVTKTAESVRRVPAIIRYQDRLLDIVYATRPKVTPIGKTASIIEKFSGWTRRSKTVRWKTELFATEREARTAAEIERAKRSEAARKNVPRPKVGHVGDSWLVRTFDGYDFAYEGVWTREARDLPEAAALAEAEREWAQTRLILCSADTAARRWRTELRSQGLRHVPISSLRHFSESIQSAAGVPSSVIAKLHGHTDFRTDFTYYIDHGESERVSAARTVDEYLRNGSAENLEFRDSSLF